MNDPSPEQIAAECLLIQSGWTPEEKIRRMSPNTRPTVRGADGREHDVSAESYHEHHEQNAQFQLQRDAVHGDC